MNVGNIPFQTYRRAGYMLACMNMLVAAGYIATYHLLRTAPFAPRRRTGRAAATFLVGSNRNEDNPGWLLFVCLSLVALMVQLLAIRTWGDLYANDVRSINEADVATGRWLAANTPPDALIAANDVGAIAYFSERQIFDMIGLASPEAQAVLRRTRVASTERDNQIKALLLEQQADYVAIFPAWFPLLAKDPMLSEVQRFTVENPTP